MTIHSDWPRVLREVCDRFPFATHCVVWRVSDAPTVSRSAPRLSPFAPRGSQQPSHPLSATLCVTFCGAMTGSESRVAPKVGFVDGHLQLMRSASVCLWLPPAARGRLT